MNCVVSMMSDQWGDGDGVTQHGYRYMANALAEAGLLAARAATRIQLPENWRHQIGACEASGTAVDLIESWIERADPEASDG